MAEKEEKFFLCSCYSEGLLASHEIYEAKVGEDTMIFDKEFRLAIFRNYTFKPNLWEGLKYAFYHLRTGQKHEDQILLNYEQAEELAVFLISKMKPYVGKD